MAKFSEKFSGYKMDKNGTYGDPDTIESEEDLKKFLEDNVQKYHELRVTDREDNLVFHVVAEVLLFPLTGGMSKNNRWNPDKMKFIGS